MGEAVRPVAHRLYTSLEIHWTTTIGLRLSWRVLGLISLTCECEAVSTGFNQINDLLVRGALYIEAIPETYDTYHHKSADRRDTMKPVTVAEMIENTRSIPL